MESLSRCVVCRYTIDRATYRVLGIDDVYPGIRQIDRETRAPLGSTMREDLERVLRAEGHDLGAIDVSFFEPVIAPWLCEETFEALAHVDPHSGASTSASTSSDRIFSEAYIATLRTVEERTRADWMQRVAIDHELWQRRQRVLAAT